LLGNRLLTTLLWRFPQGGHRRARPVHFHSLTPAPPLQEPRRRAFWLAPRVIAPSDSLNSAPLGGSLDLLLENLDSLAQHLAFNLPIGDLSVAGEAAQEVALGAVEVGAGFVAALEDDREAATRIADGRAENGARQIAGKARAGRAGAGPIEAKGPPAVESSGERQLGGLERIGVRCVPPRAHAPPEDPIFLAKQRRRSETQGAHRLVHQKAFDVGEAFGALNILTDGAEPFLRAAEVPVEQSVHKFGGPFVRAR